MTYLVNFCISHEFLHRIFTVETIATKDLKQRQRTLQYSHHGMVDSITYPLDKKI